MIPLTITIVSFLVAWMNTTRSKADCKNKAFSNLVFLFESLANLYIYGMAAFTSLISWVLYLGIY